MDPVNRNIRELRIAHGMTQAEVARWCRVSRPGVSKWESGDSTPTLEHLRKLAKLWRTTVDGLLR